MAYQDIIVSCNLVMQFATLTDLRRKINTMVSEAEKAFSTVRFSE